MTSERRLDATPLVPTWLDPLPTLGLAGAEPTQNVPNHRESTSTDEHEDDQPAPVGRLDREAHLRRLRRIERQVRGLQRMIDQDVYPIDVLTQIAAVARALQSVAVGLFDEHFRMWFADAVEQHGAPAGDMIDEATRAIEGLLRS